ncbi:hypothetical protein FNH13_07405 [Ornithinimicrobium ciconiae]|uniref:Tissue inhibitor of metalloproteinase n=1 Tax=Ornithinimicrobium ciconiae TaxID=2594265 RepID=A0A516G9I1_9MICO|nr:hypothetical protein [Ornithinimicrobium ciconiae]QDO88189.1 hypothetical protein FNH13_07405 [Ornithinimicrobium ciconiae]
MINRTAVRGGGVAAAGLLLAPALVLLAPAAAMACSCAVADTETLVGYVDTIAVGELATIEAPPTRADGAVDTADQVTYTVTLQTVLKGEPDNPLVFRSASHGASCGLEDMAVGRDYVFFVRDGESGLCDGTSRATPTLIAEVEAVTGPGQEPMARAADPATGSDTAPGSVDQAPAAELESGLPTALPWIALTAGVVTVGLGWLLWTRRSRND